MANIEEQQVLGSVGAEPQDIDYIPQRQHLSDHEIPFLPRDVWTLETLSRDQKAEMASVLTRVAGVLLYEPPSTVHFGKAWEALLTISKLIAQEAVYNITGQEHPGRRPDTHVRATDVQRLVDSINLIVPHMVEKMWTWQPAALHVLIRNVHPFFEKLTPEQRWWFYQYRKSCNGPAPSLEDFNVPGTSPYRVAFRPDGNVPYLPRDLRNVAGIHASHLLALYHTFDRAAQTMLVKDPESNGFIVQWRSLRQVSLRCWNSTCVYHGVSNSSSMRRI
jgi:hypothetical protein